MLSKLPALLALLAATAGLAAPAGLRGAANGTSQADATGPPSKSSARVQGTAPESAGELLPRDVLFLNVTDAIMSGIDGEESDSSEAGAAAAQVVLGASAQQCPHSDKVNDPSESCAASVNSQCAGCALYHMCQGRSACVVNGYLVVPGAPLRGMEDINGGSAASWDFLWSVAAGQCGGDSCVLISNPEHFRTQHQMHLHYRRYNGGGAAMKRRLEAALCGTSGWQPFSQCGRAKARLYDGMPGVFSAVAGAYGGGSLANVGITVWFTSACGGRQVMLLATTGCSIEHGITR